MKKVIICAIIAALIMTLISCSFRPATGLNPPAGSSDTPSGESGSSSSDGSGESGSASSSESQSESESESQGEPPVPAVVLPVGIYLQQGYVESYDIKETMSGTWSEGMTLACFAILPSNDANVTGTTYAGLWNAEYDENISDKSARLGFLLAVSTGTRTETAMILDPDDTAAVKYMSIYLYDDIHQTTGWYGHLNQSDFNADTMISSFKIVAGSGFDQVKSIVLSAFWYTPDQIVNGVYTGSNMNTVTITPN